MSFNKNKPDCATLNLMLLKTVVGIILLFLAIMVLRPFDSSGPLDKFLKKPSNSTSQNNTPSNTAPVKFTQPIFKVEDIDWVSPLGESNGGFNEILPLAGMTVNIKKEVAAKGPIEVRAPTDMMLTSYANYIVGSEPSDWALIFQISDNLSLTLHHINNASSKITDVVGNNPKRDDSRTSFLNSPIKFKAGEIIGTTKGTTLANNWNIYLYDKATNNQFINQKKYEGSEMGQRLINGSCIFDYYQDPKIKESFYTLLGTTKPGQATSCGTPSKDKKGTLSGLWHLKKEGIDFGSYDGDYADPFSIYMRADKSIMIYEMARKYFTVYPTNPTYKNPEEITSSHCYLLTDNWNPNAFKSQGYAYFRVDSDTQMSVFYSSSGSCPKEFPERAAKVYYR